MEVRGSIPSCPHCGSTKPMSNVYACEDEHEFCETCANAKAVGLLREYVRFCPVCGKPQAATVGWLSWDKDKD